MKKYIGVASLLLFAVTLQAQDYIKGHVKEKGSGKRLPDVFIKNSNNKQITVTDEKGNPVANASVLVKGTTTGTTTKADGTYSLSVPANGKVLVISSVDMLTQEVNIGGQTNLTITLNTTS